MFYDERNVQVLKTLEPTVENKLWAVLTECDKQGIWLLLTAGYRSNFAQNMLYALGRWIPGRIVTHAKGGKSMHNYGLAVDFVPADGVGKVHYEDTARINQIAAIAKSMGWQWGGDWVGFKDPCHLEYLGGHDEAFFINGGHLI